MQKEKTMEFETKKEFIVNDNSVKLQVVTGIKSAEDEEEHFCVVIQDFCREAVSTFFHNRKDANACFETFLKMKTFDD